jgi:RNA polymerase sigma-70 factor (ECF subfamily)
MLHAFMPMPLREVDVPLPLKGGSPPADETAALRVAVRAVIAAVLGIGKNHPDVEDCTHEALSRAIEGKTRLREGEPLRPWVLGIARHVALDALRERRRARKVTVSSEGEEAQGSSWIERVADPGPGPEERAASAERARKVEAAIGALSHEQREALLLFHEEGLGYQEIAKRMGVPLGTVATWISRGRRLVAEALDEQARSR